MLEKYDKASFSLEFPKFLDSLKCAGINIETVGSSNLQKVVLKYAHNIATHKKAVIFVTNPKPYNDQEAKA